MAKDIYIIIPNEQTYKQAVINAMLSPWLFAFPNRILPKYGEIKKCFHGNSKLLLHLFYNGITKCHEMQITTSAIEKSYPHIGKLNIVNWEAVNYEMCCEVFGVSA